MVSGLERQAAADGEPPLSDEELELEPAAAGDLRGALEAIAPPGPGLVIPALLAIFFFMGRR
jgi:hypothetical protein